jgi:hypothetical protein
MIITSFIIVYTLSFCFFSIQSIYAHKEIQVGNYTLEVGWEEEPPLLDMRNNIVLYVFENESAVRNAMKDLSTTINYGGLSKELNFVPSEESAGLYLAELLPSQLGTYTLNLTGTIGTQAINNNIQIEDVEDANRITFPFVSDGDGSNVNLENIGKQITPIINDLSNQFDESIQEMNATKELIQKMNDQINALNSQIERTNLLSYIATGLGIAAIILVVAYKGIRGIKKTA